MKDSLRARRQAIHPFFAERLLLRFSMESHAHETPEAQVKLEAKKAVEKTAPPEKPEEAKKAVDALVGHAEAALQTKVRAPLLHLLGRLENARDTLKDLPPDAKNGLEETIGRVQAELDCHTVAGTLKHFSITIEHPKGSLRAMKMRDGSLNPVKQTCHYGRIDAPGGKLADDGEPPDVYIGPDVQDFTHVFLIDQGDETKYMVGFKSPKQALDAYMQNHPEKSPGDVPPPQAMAVADFQEKFAPLGRPRGA